MLVLIYWILGKLLEKILKFGLFMLILCLVGNSWNYVRIMVIIVNLLDFIQIVGQKNVEIWVIYVNFCIVWNNWNYVEVIILNVNLLDFTDMADVMSHGGDAGGDPPQRGNSRVPSQCESCKY